MREAQSTPEEQLHERVKELRTLYRASRVLSEEPEGPLSARLQEFIDTVPDGWQYPDITTARLVLEGCTVTSQRFRETPWMQSAEIANSEGWECHLDVALLEERPARDEGPFLKEERELLEALAAEVGRAASHRRVARLHALTLASIEEAVIIVDARGSGRVMADVNPAAERMFGWSRAELIGRGTVMLHVDTATFERFGVESCAALDDVGVFRGTYLMRRRDGGTFEAEQTVTLLRADQGSAGGAVSVIRDVSKRRRAEAELRETEERFRQIAEHIDHVYWVRTPGRAGIDYVSPAYERVWGRSSEELYRDADSWLNHLLPSDRRRLMESPPEGEAARSGQEYRIIRPDGEVRWILDRAFPVFDAEKRVQRIVGVAEDITTRKQLEQQFGVLSQEITDVIYVVAVDGTVLRSSPSVETVLGYGPAEFNGSDAFSAVHPDDRSELRARFTDIVPHPGITARAQYRVVTRGGDVRHVESVVRNLIDHPAARGILFTSRDVTERLDIEERLRQTQKLEAVGRLAGGVAHDFNNIMTVIRSQTDLLLMDMPAGPLVSEIEIIQGAADRAARLTAQLLAFSRDQVLRPIVVDPSAVIRDLDRIIERAVGEKITVTYDLPADLPSIVIDPSQLEQVVMNLAVNARDAMPDGGTLSIAANTRTDRCGDGGGSTPEQAERRIFLEVRDTGTGMDEEVRSRLFEPFYTTKPRGKGTGLGLALVYGVVTQSGGTITVESEPGGGATFCLSFPVTDAMPAAERAPPRATPPADVDGNRVLLVEDDPNVSRVTVRILEREGFDVTAVGDAEAGLALVQQDQRFLLLLTDLGLPGISGRELAERVLTAAPGVPIIVMSGYDVESPGQQVELPAVVTFLQKPFTRQELLATVKSKLTQA